jgi:hypothetical protein
MGVPSVSAAMPASGGRRRKSQNSFIALGHEAVDGRLEVRDGEEDDSLPGGNDEPGQYTFNQSRDSGRAKLNNGYTTIIGYKQPLNR